MDISLVRQSRSRRCAGRITLDKFDGVLTNRFHSVYFQNHGINTIKKHLCFRGSHRQDTIIDCPCVVEPGFADTNIHGKTACRLHSKSGSDRSKYTIYDESVKDSRHLCSIVFAVAVK